MTLSLVAYSAVEATGGKKNAIFVLSLNHRLNLRGDKSDPWDTQKWSQVKG